MQRIYDMALPVMNRPVVTVRPEGDVYVVTTDFGDVATFHRFVTQPAADAFVAGRGRAIVTARRSKSSVKSIDAKMKLSKTARKQ
jgi:hypothetical protein